MKLLNLRNTLLNQSGIHMAGKELVTFWILLVSFFPNFTGAHTDYADRLLCFYQNGELLYPENPPSCFITGVENLEVLTSVNVFPNPFSGYLIIEDEEKGMEQYLIYNNLGQYVQGGLINNSFSRIEPEELPRGLFYLILMDREGRRYSTRLVKQ